MNSFSKFAAVAVIGGLAATTASAECLNLTQHIQNGPYGGGVYQVAGWEVTIKIDELWGPPSNPTPNAGGYAEMVDTECFGEKRSLWLNNTYMRIFIEGGPEVERANVNFCNFGGYVNVDVAENTPPQFVGNLRDLPPVLVDDRGDPVEMSLRGAAREGKLVYDQAGGSIRQMVAGGQEFFVNSICLN